MNIGLYQSASALSALERWQDSMAQNITSSQTTGYRKRTINFSTLQAGELRADSRTRGQSEPSMSMQFPKVNSGVNFITGEMHPTRRELDAAIQRDGFFEMQMKDGTKAYSRSGEFRVRPDRTLVTGGDNEVLSEGGAPITLIAGGGPVTINRDGSIFQGDTALGKLSIKRFANPAELIPIKDGFFVPAAGAEALAVDDPELMQGYLEGSNVTPLREMVDLVLISRAYEANQKIISTVDQQMQKTLEALG